MSKHHVLVELRGQKKYQNAQNASLKQNLSTVVDSKRWFFFHVSRLYFRPYF